MANLDIVLSASNMAGAELAGIAKSLERSADALGDIGKPLGGDDPPFDPTTPIEKPLQGTLNLFPGKEILKQILIFLGSIVTIKESLGIAFGEDKVDAVLDVIRDSYSFGFTPTGVGFTNFPTLTDFEALQNTNQSESLERRENPFSNAQAEWLTEGDPFTIIAQLDTSEFEASIASLQGMWDSLIESINQIDTSAAAEALASTVGAVTANMEANVIGIVGGLNSLDGKEIDVDIFIHILGELPGMASGGSVSAGNPYIVGERGFELFVPSQSGRIVPHNESRQMLSGGGSTINIFAPLTIQASNGASLQQILEELA